LLTQGSSTLATLQFTLLAQELAIMASTKTKNSSRTIFVAVDFGEFCSTLTHGGTLLTVLKGPPILALPGLQLREYVQIPFL